MTPETTRYRFTVEELQQADDWSLEPSETEMDRVMTGHAEFFGAMA